MFPIVACSVSLAPNGRDLKVDVENLGSATFKSMRDLRLGLASFIESRGGPSRNDVEIALL